MKAILFGAALLGLSILAIAQPPSLFDASPPYVDGSASVGQYSLTGSARSTTKGIVLTSAPHQTGAMWHSTPLMYSSWQVMIKFYVTGSSSEGDHGWAFWFTDRPGQHGNVFGNLQNFNGFALIFDSKDNDGHRNNPSVAAHLYDGTKAFNHADDGVADQLSGCVADYRNRNEPVTARITYKRPGKLDIYLDLSNRGRFQRCMSLENIQMPYSYFVGVTAMTEEKDDNHVIESIKITDMTDSNDPPPPAHAHHTTPPPQQQQQQQQPPAQQQQQYTPPAQQYTPPAQQYTPPAQQYTPPAQQYTPPAQQYTPPPPPPPPQQQQQYTPPPPPAQQYTPPPAQQQQQQYQPAAATASLGSVSEDAIRKAVSAALLEQLQSTQNQIADRVRGLVADSARELRDNTDRWASKHSDLLQKEVIPLLQAKAATGGTGGTGADFSEVMKMLREREDKIDNSVRTLSESLVSVRDILARPASGSGNVRSELEPVIRQQEQIVRDLAALKKDLAALTQLSSISQNVDRVHRTVGSLEAAVSQGIGSLASSSGGSYIVYGLLAAILAAVIYVIVQNKNESRYGKLI